MGNRSVLLGLCVLAVVAVVLSGLALTRSHSVPRTMAAPAPAPEATPISAPTPAPAPAPAPRTIVFLGDGYTADSPWPTEVGAALGWHVVNLAESGTGYRVAPSTCRLIPCTSFGKSAPRVAEAQPAAVVIAGGEVDGSSVMKSDVETALRELQKAVPQAEVIVLPPLSSRSTRPEWLIRTEQTVQEAAQQANVTWVDTTSVTADSRAYRSGDLTDQASKDLAGLVVAELN